MKIHVQFFSRLKEAAACTNLDVELTPGSSLADLLRVLFEIFPPLVQWEAHLLLAVGLEYALPEQTLHDGDEVSIMPPVQGG